MDKGVTLTVKEQKRLRVLVEVDAGRLTGREAAEVLGISLRQAWRLLAALREKGAAGLAHGNRGREPVNKTPPATRERIAALAQKRYADYNDSHFTEKLEQEHRITVSRSTLRRIRRSIGQGSPRKCRRPRHRKRRERYSQSGMLLQLDGSPHDWLEGRGPRLTLLVAIDDASSEVPNGVFRQQEDDAGYLELLWGISRSHGLPQAVYTDRHTIFQSPKRATLEQELAGERPRSQFGRIMDELEIEMIPAYSPQAKGRVERLLGTFQDRLVKELREGGASTRDEANHVLKRFLPQFSARFGVAPAQAGSAYRPWPQGLKPEEVFCFKHHRTVNNDNTISFDGKRLQIPPGPDRVSYARARVQVQQRLDGSLAICRNGRTLVVYQPATSIPVRVGKFTPAPSAQSPSPAKGQPPMPALTRTRTPHKPSPDHPWRRYPISPSAGLSSQKLTQTERQSKPVKGRSALPLTLGFSHSTTDCPRREVTFSLPT
jgi:transposase